MTTQISQNLLQPGQRLIYENTLTATANQIDISGLAGIEDGGYYIEVDYHNTATDGGVLQWFSGYLYFNTDYVNTNYDFHYIYNAVSGNYSTGNSAYAWYTDKNGPCQLRIDVSVVNNNGTKYVTATVNHQTHNDSSFHGVTRSVAVTDLTDIRVHGTGVSSSPFEIGTVIRVYRKL